MFYTTIGGWILLYVFKMACGEFEGKNADEIAGVFGNLMEKPGLMTICMSVVVAACFGIVCMGLQKGVEKITKKMMLLLLALMVILAIRSATLPGAGEGIRFYLLPDFKKAAESGMKEVIFAAMGQSFFTLSLGIGAIAIFGSYIDKKRRLTGEAVWRDRTGYMRGTDRWNDHLSSLLCIWSSTGQWSESDFYYTAEYF